MNNYVIAFIFLTLATISFIPYWTRKTENFGVTIPTSLYDRPDFKAMRKKYTTILLLLNFLLLISLFGISTIVEESTLFIVFNVATVTYIVASFLIYLPFHYKMKKLKHDEEWNKDRKQTVVIDTKFRDEKLTHSNWWYIIPALIIIATIAYTLINYGKIPDQVPIHTSFSGNVTYNDKSIGNVLLLPFTQIFMLAIFLIVNYVIKQSKQQVNVENREVSRRQNILFRRRWSLFMLVMAILMTAMFTFMQMTFIYHSLLKYEDIVIYSVIGIILFGTIFLSFKTGQGGSRISVTDQKSDDQVIERDDDHHWKLGQFYVNKDDPSIFVEKRFGVGWTNNWAHPVSWIFLLTIIGLGIAIPVFITMF